MIALVKQSCFTRAHAYASDTFIIPLGSTVFAEIQGVIDACIKLSGMPDLSLSFMVSFVLFCNSFMSNIYEVLNEMINTDRSGLCKKYS